jgi:hypothetical protein
MSEERVTEGFRRHRFTGRSIELPDNLTEAQLDGRACIHCATEDQPTQPVEAWSELSSQLFECADVEACAARCDDVCSACRHEWRWHTTGGMCAGADGASECHCIMIRAHA